MRRIRVNYKSDLPPIEVKFKVNGVERMVPDGDFAIRFYIDGAPGTSFACSHIDGVYSNCEKITATSLMCYIDNHKFGCGRLCCEYIDMSKNAKYEDGVLKTVTPSSLDVVLVDGVGDDNVEVINAIFGFEPNGIESIVTEESYVDGGTNHVTITQTNGTETTFGIKNGTKGSQGVQGEMGPQGETGPQGVKGDQGDSGFQGDFDDFEVKNNLTDGGVEAALSAEMGKRLGNMAAAEGAVMVFYDSSSTGFSDGYHYNTGSSPEVGDAAPSDKEEWAGHGCIKISVKAGEQVEIRTKGLSYARAYFVTNRVSTIIALAAANTDTTSAPVTLSIETDGYVYVNCVKDSEDDYDYFGIIHYKSTTVSRVDKAEQDIISKPTMEKTTYSQTDFMEPIDPNSLGINWRTIGNVGSVAPDAPQDIQVNYRCLDLIEVKKGDVVILSTVGGSAAKAYALTNKSKVIVQVADANLDTTANPVVLNVTADGYLYVNCAGEAYDVFGVTHYHNEFENIKKDTEAVEDLYNITTSVYGWNDLINNGANGRTWVYNSTMSVVPYSVTGGPWWKSLEKPVPVKAGDKVIVSTVGGTSALAYTLTDNNMTALSNSGQDADTTGTPAVLNVEEDGYLFINCDTKKCTNFFVRIVHVKQKESRPATYKNNTLPMWKDEVKILAIGNSYTEDSLTYMSDFLTAAGIADRVAVYALICYNSSLGQWDGIYDSGRSLESNSAFCRRFAGSLHVQRKTGLSLPSNANDMKTYTMSEILACDWDVVTMQQYSRWSVDYSSFNPYLSNLVQAIRQNCPNPKVCLAWHSTWSYKKGYLNDQPNADRWGNIIDVTQRMILDRGIDVIIPTGTAIQNARGTSISTGQGEMTRDGTHLAYGAGRYIATATWFESLLSPILGVSVVGNRAVHQTAEGTSTYDFIAVTSSNRLLCQRCALAACVDRWNVTELE